MAYQKGHARLNEMIKIMENGLVITGLGAGSIVMFSTYPDASTLAKAVSNYGREAGTVRQFWFDANSMHQVGTNNGVVIRKGEMPEATPAGQKSLFGVFVDVSEKRCEKLFGGLIEKGKLVHKDDPNLADKFGELVHGTGRKL